MPDILIRGVEMPENCGECFISSLGRCKVAGKEIVLWQTNRKDDRPLFCHLYELPPHGDLIDRDELEPDLAIWKGECGDPAFSEEAIDSAPVIVPASEPTKSG